MKKKDLESWIRENGLKLPAFAKRVGIPYQTVYGYMRGDRSMPEDFLQKSAIALKIKREDILQGGEEALHDRAGAAYNANAVVELMSPQELITRLTEYVRGLTGADAERTGVLVDAIHACAEDLRRKTEK